MAELVLILFVISAQRGTNLICNGYWLVILLFVSGRNRDGLRWMFRHVNMACSVCDERLMLAEFSKRKALFCSMKLTDIYSLWKTKISSRQFCQYKGINLRYYERLRYYRK